MREGQAPSLTKLFASTFVYLDTGNGTWDGSRDWGDSYVKLSPVSGMLSEADFFTPFNASPLTADDRDLGSGMATLFPTFTSSKFAHIMIGAGKEDRIYVVNRDNMGHFDSACDCQIVQSIPKSVGVPINNTDLQHNYSTPPYWNGNVYFSGTNDSIKRFHLNTLTSMLTTTPSDHSPTTYAFPGSNVVISASGNGSGILWVVEKSASVLHAYDAQCRIPREIPWEVRSSSHHHW
jgi:hypothetical protein